MITSCPRFLSSSDITLIRLEHGFSSVYGSPICRITLILFPCSLTESINSHINYNLYIVLCHRKKRRFCVFYALFISLFHYFLVIQLSNPLTSLVHQVDHFFFKTFCALAPEHNLQSEEYDSDIKPQRLIFNVEKIKP